MVERCALDAAAHGMYRVPELPRDRYDELILARFWAAGRGVISHDSALLVHELCDINPAVVHCWWSSGQSNPGVQFRVELRTIEPRGSIQGGAQDNRTQGFNSGWS
jgi:predicted transcriptional regulator of viral defense system